MINPIYPLLTIIKQPLNLALRKILSLSISWILKKILNFPKIGLAKQNLSLPKKKTQHKTSSLVNQMIQLIKKINPLKN
jgi:hypothetical protein